jgi:DNA-directed RNA polymerase specialized sigma24 family protein
MNRATGGEMTAKEYLAQAYHLDHRISAKLEQVEALRSLTQRVTVSYGREPVSHTRNISSMEDSIIRLMEAENALNRTIDALVEMKMDIAQCIDAVPNHDCQLLLEKRYLCFQSWEQIAIDMQCTVRWVHILHGRALRVIDRLRGTEDDHEQA